MLVIPSSIFSFNRLLWMGIARAENVELNFTWEYVLCVVYLCICVCVACNFIISTTNFFMENEAIDHYFSSIFPHSFHGKLSNSESIKICLTSYQTIDHIKSAKVYYIFILFFLAAKKKKKGYPKRWFRIICKIIIN